MIIGLIVLGVVALGIGFWDLLDEPAAAGPWLVGFIALVAAFVLAIGPRLVSPDRLRRR